VTALLDQPAAAPIVPPTGEPSAAARERADRLEAERRQLEQTWAAGPASTAG
jgi:hypothetical protein